MSCNYVCNCQIVTHNQSLVVEQPFLALTPILAQKTTFKIEKKLLRVGGFS